MSCTDKIIVLVDMDCFYCQVEEKLNPSLAGKPIAVVQYNEWRGGGIIAVNYPAREKGVTRHMRGNEAKQKCPGIVLARVPEIRGKADLTKYREAGKEVVQVLKTFTPLLERASVDEAYLDITDVVNKRMTDFEQISIENMKNSYVVGWDIEDFLHNIHQNREYTESNCKLAMGGLIAEEIRAEVFRKTGYKCSAGIAHNKILAKVVCGLHKPNKQTLIPQESVAELYKDLPLKKIKSLGGKFGNKLSQELNITTMGELSKYNKNDLAARYDKRTANRLYNIARGIDLEPVSARHITNSICCSKTFPGRNALVTTESVRHWTIELASDVSVKLTKDLEENNRKAKQMVISFAQKKKSGSKTLPLTSYNQNKIAELLFKTINKFCLKSDGTYNITYLGISVGNFKDNEKGMSITSFFKNKNSVSELQNPGPATKNMELDHYEIVETESTCTDIQEDLLEEISDVDTHCDDENVSVYSATTEDLNEDTNLIYYEDIYPESVSQPILENKIADDYIYKILISQCVSEKNNIIVNEQSSSNSFFTKYFKSSANDSAKISRRDFDTSKILEELDSSVENDMSNEEIVEVEPSSCNVTPQTYPTNEKLVTEFVKSDLKEACVESDLKETCVECKKKIFPWELVSHMDYHYALKIVRNESHLYKSAPNILPKGSLENENSKQGVKRKVSEVKDANTIIAFLRKGNLNDENSALCDECNKRIKLDEVSSHADYHAAKKLQQEINANFSTANKTNTEKNVKPKNKKQKCDSTTKKFDYFMKPS